MNIKENGEPGDILEFGTLAESCFTLHFRKLGNASAWH